MKGAPRSKHYDDVYFSAEDGLAETRHVFLQGNNLPAAWAGKDRFVIAETGFGTGLNFLAAWRLWRDTVTPGASLDFISVEKYPLSAAEISESLSGWRADLGPELDALCAAYPALLPGFHRIVFDGGVSLTLIFDDIADALPQITTPIDCWFLDGFKPAANPDMWTPFLFARMARLTRPGGTFATFTAAGAVRRGLTDAGFAVEKARGFGRKRDMLRGTFTGGTP